MSESLFALPSDAYAVTSDDCYTPRWLFDAMGLEFELSLSSLTARTSAFASPSLWLSAALAPSLPNVSLLLTLLAQCSTERRLLHENPRRAAR